MHKVRDILSGRGRLVFLCFIILWIVYIGTGLWGYASVETEPPVFDALSYVQKAQSFWSAVNKRELFNPLSITPTIRPFGTVLMSYPFGFTEDFRGFYFRSLFIPIVLYAIAVIFVVSVRKLSAKQLLVLFSIAVALTSAPANFQLQNIEGTKAIYSSWGLVDSFFASILAIATAFAVRRNNKLVVNSFICSSLSALSILVKPAGLMMMAVVGVVWLIVHAHRDPRQWIKDSEFIQASVVFVVVYGVTLVSVIGSEYFSLEHAEYGVRSMQVVHGLIPDGPTLFRVAEQVHITIGAVLAMLLCAALAYSIHKSMHRYYLAIFFVLVSGVWLWLFKSNIDHVRYFLPFLAIALILVVPVMLDAIEPFSHKTTALTSLMLLAPSFVIGYLLFANEPDHGLQHLVGTNLSSNIQKEAVTQSEKLRDNLIKDGRGVNIIYYVGIESTQKVRAFAAVMEYDRLVGGAKANTIPALPMDYVREHAYRLDEIIQARFIVSETVEDPLEILTSNKAIDNFELEELMIRAWLANLTESNGISIRSQSPVRVLEVIDRKALNTAANNFYESYHWREPFLRGFTKHSWVSQSVIDALYHNLIKEAVDLYLGNELMASIMGVALSRDENDVVLSVYIKQFKSLYKMNDITNWFIFVHLLHAGEARKDVFQVAYIDGLGYSGSIGEYKIRFSAEKLTGVTGLATGIYSQKVGYHDFMLSESGDWGGKRVTIQCMEICSNLIQ